MLSEVKFDYVYSSGDTEPEDFFLHALMNSSTFDLGLGFFNSSGFRTLAMGFAIFIHKGGTMRFIINDSLSEEDKLAIQNGLVKSPEELIENNLINSLKNLTSVLSSYDKHFFRCLSWLISTKRLEIKAYMPQGERGGIVHQKFGIFKDNNNNSVAFSGSANFSKSALRHNLESITCHVSWNNEISETTRIKLYSEQFNAIWDGNNNNIKQIPIDRVKTYLKENFNINNIKELLDEENDLVDKSSLSIKSKNKYRKSFTKAADIVSDYNESYTFEKELVNPFTLRPYQHEAIKAWFDNNCVGLYEMATGTGKTITALAAALDLVKKDSKKIILISCPFIHLVEQWSEEAHKFGLRPIIVAESRKIWEPLLKRELELFKRQSINIVTIITTNVSMVMETFQNLLSKQWGNTLFIADECHYLGSANIRKFLPNECKNRLGLSATPERYYDDDGSKELIKYFDKIVYSLPLKDAIGEFLTPYYYYPTPVEMTDEEFEEYLKITKIMQLYSHTESEKNSAILEQLAIKRSRIQNNSISKVEWVRENINNKNINYTLFYAGDKIFDDIKRILGLEKKIKIHEFTGEQNRKQRKDILNRFLNKKLQALIAMKCLDEGVDVPPTRTAYFLASSGNPREFIQRRGRVLRKSEGKDYSIIYDLISIPPLERISQLIESEETSIKAAFRKEFKRIKEFSELAINKNSSFEQIFDIALKLNIIGE